MSTPKPNKLPASDRSMQPQREERSRVFFFPKHNPPVSIRAASREEAEKLLAGQEPRLEDPNQKENE